MKILSLNGSAGGGQMLRTALSLSMITGRPFCMTGIRGQRPKPGLMRQHLTCLNAACEISDGSADGAEIGATEIQFRPGKVRGGSHQFAIGTAGSTTLLLQTLLPALLGAETASTLRLEGGTHNPMAPPFEFIERVFLPVLKRMGGDVQVHLLQTGFAPVGGGAILCEVQPCAQLQPIELHERGELLSLKLRVPIRKLSISIGGRILDSALSQLPCDDASVEAREEGPGRGVCCLYEATYENASEISTAFGEAQVTSEKVGRRAAKGLQHFMGSKVAVGRHLADQILIPMALAGRGSFTTIVPDDHVMTNIAVIQKFLDLTFNIQEAERGRRVIEIC